MKKLLYLLSSALIPTAAFAEPIVDWPSVTGMSYRTYNVKVTTTSESKFYIYSLDSFPCIAGAGASTSNPRYTVMKNSTTNLKVKCVYRPETLTFAYKIEDSNRPSNFSSSALAEGIIDCPVRVQNDNKSELNFEILIDECNDRPIPKNI